MLKGKRVLKYGQTFIYWFKRQGMEDGRDKRNVMGKGQRIVKCII